MLVMKENEGKDTARDESKESLSEYYILISHVKSNVSPCYQGVREHGSVFDIKSYYYSSYCCIMLVK